jgi:L-fuconolactonase
MNEKIQKIDSHHHLWVVNDTDYPWMGPELGRIRRDFLHSDLEAVLDASGMDGSVAVQARQMVVETDWLLEIAEASTRIRGVVGWVPLCEADCAAVLDQYASRRLLVGVRHVVHDEPDDDFILRDDFNRGISLLENYGLAYDLLIFWKHLGQTIRFVDRHPGQVFVLDHIAKPRIAREAFDAEWAAGIRELARRGNVSCKISGVLTEVRGDTWDMELLKPYLDTVYEAFGPERVMFGSDWPVCLLRESHAGWVRLVGEWAAPLSPDEKAALWGGNATRIYGLE